MATEMDELPEEVREAVNSIDHVLWGRMTAEAAMLGAARSGPSSDWRTVRAELLRLTCSESDLRGANKRLTILLKNAEAELAALRKRVFKDSCRAEGQHVFDLLCLPVEFDGTLALVKIDEAENDDTHNRGNEA